MSQKHTYALHYFDIRGRGEPIRLIFKYHNVRFTDNRISHDEWPHFKADAPMGQLPYLVVDDGKLTLCQTLAICRYLAKSLSPHDYFGGATKSDAAKCDMYAEAFMDLFSIGVEASLENDPEIKSVKQAIFEDQYSTRLKLLENHLKRNGGDQFVGKKVLWCDLVAISVLSMLAEIKDDILDGLPDLEEYYKNVCSLPQIKEYIEETWPTHGSGSPKASSEKAESPREEATEDEEKEKEEEE